MKWCNKSCFSSLKEAMYITTKIFIFECDASNKGIVAMMMH